MVLPYAAAAAAGARAAAMTAGAAAAAAAAVVAAAVTLAILLCAHSLYTLGPKNGLFAPAWQPLRDQLTPQQMLYVFLCISAPFTVLV